MGGDVTEPGRRAGPTGDPAELSPPDTPRYSPDWLTLREGADADARSTELAGALSAYLSARRSPGRPLVVHDLGCGTGSMGRWLAGRLPGPQHWVLHDRDPGLLDLAAAGLPRVCADGGSVTVETRRGDLTGLTATALGGASLVTASALLDLLTDGEVDRLADTCVAVGAPALFALSVVGRVELTPAEEFDAEVAAAFDAHQRRAVGGRRLLGPAAVAAATGAFGARGAEVRVHDTPWRLGPGRSALTAEWLRGWVAAAVEHRPELAAPAGEYLRRRLAACAEGRLTAVVGHADLLALPPNGGAAR